MYTANVKHSHKQMNQQFILTPKDGKLPTSGDSLSQKTS